MKILIIDDSKDIHILIDRLLKSAGFEDNTFVLSAQDGLQCLERCNTDPMPQSHPSTAFDLIILDIIMEGIDGISACKKIRENQLFNNVPIIMITSLQSEDLLQEAFNAGATDYITKPIKRIEFLARVNSALLLKKDRDSLKKREIELRKTSHQLQIANQVLQDLYTTDPLTNIDNRGHFDLLLDSEWKRAKREKNLLSLIMIDIDYFKSFNDTYGHQGGDNCLIQVANAISESLKRPADFAARYGGEEFAVGLPNTDLNGAVQIAEEIRLRVYNLKIEHQGSDAEPFLTISGGVATILPKEEILPSKLISLADIALYRAKKTGRNNIKINRSDN